MKKVHGEFKSQFYANTDRRLVELREKSTNFHPLFKTKEEAQAIIDLIKNWRDPATRKRKEDDRDKVPYVRRDYRLRQSMRWLRVLELMSFVRGI